MNRLSLKLNPATSYFPTPERCSIIGSSRLNFRVRDGNGCDPADKITGKLVNIKMTTEIDNLYKLRFENKIC